MNETEQIFVDDLLHKGINFEDILFFQRDSPDFIVRNQEKEIGYEIKSLFGNHISITKEQLNKILNKDFETFLVIVDKKRGVLDKVPIRNLLDINKKEINGTKIVWKQSVGMRIDVQFESGFSETLKKWKELCFFCGGQTKRLEVIITADVKKIKEDIKSEVDKK